MQFVRNDYILFNVVFIIEIFHFALNVTHCSVIKKGAPVWVLHRRVLICLPGAE